MTTSPDSAKRRPDQTPRHPAAPHNGVTNGNGNGYGTSVDAEVRSIERRRHPRQAAQKDTSTSCPR